MAIFNSYVKLPEGISCIMSLCPFISFHRWHLTSSSWIPKFFIGYDSSMMDSPRRWAAPLRLRSRHFLSPGIASGEDSRISPGVLPQIGRKAWCSPKVGNLNWGTGLSTGEYLMKLSLCLDHQTGKVSAIWSSSSWSRNLFLFLGLLYGFLWFFNSPTVPRTTLGRTLKSDFVAIWERCSFLDLCPSCSFSWDLSCR